MKEGKKEEKWGEHEYSDTMKGLSQKQGRTEEQEKKETDMQEKRSTKERKEGGESTLLVMTG